MKITLCCDRGEPRTPPHDSTGSETSGYTVVTPFPLENNCAPKRIRSITLVWRPENKNTYKSFLKMSRRDSSMCLNIKGAPACLEWSYKEIMIFKVKKDVKMFSLH